jgi:dTMP kinase
MAGRFIAFEGIDTEILSDQAERLANWLRMEAGIKSVVVTREPSDGPLGAQLRLFSGGRLTLHEYPLAALRNADGMDHLYREDGILNDLQKGSCVITVRYLLSSLICYSEVVSLDWLIRINQLCRWPDITFFLDTPVTSALTRIVYEHGFNSEEVDLQKVRLEKARSRYLKIIDLLLKQSKRIEVIESDSATVIHKKCIGFIQNSVGEETIL